MKIGFITNSLSRVGIDNIEEIFKWGKEKEFNCLEIGPAIPLKVERLQKLQEKYGLQITSFIYMRNILARDRKERELHTNKIKERIDAANRLNVKYVTISTGRDEKKSYAENFTLLEKEFAPILKYAEKKNVTIALENCPEMWNIAISPLMWRKIFKVFPSSNLGLCFDPSHLVWLRINPYKAILDFRDKICYVHAKDTEIMKEKLDICGIFTDQIYGEKPECEWWRPRLPGWGEINWRNLITNLIEAGFDGTINIEHEDSVWSGSKKKVEKGLILTRNYLKGMI